jgi:uncharacterized SAM-binding protein YcdF (DUF218 family)
MVLLCLLVFSGLVYLLRHPLLRLAGQYWVVQDPLERADALIVLSDDNFYADRATYAAELYRRRMAPIVVASGRRLRPYVGIAELMEHDLVERGVPESAVVKVSHLADNTREEAEALRTLIEERHWRRVIVVTSSFHTRRARYVFRHVFPATVEVRAASARDFSYDPAHWWQTRLGQKQFFHEAVGMLVAWWELRKSANEGVQPQSVVEKTPFNAQYVVSQGRKSAIFATAFSSLQPLSPVLSSRA